jgi:hypothetical protein
MSMMIFCDWKNFVGSHPLAAYDAEGVGHVDGSGEFEDRSEGMEARYKERVRQARRKGGSKAHGEEPDLDASGRPIHRVHATSEVLPKAV